MNKLVRKTTSALLLVLALVVTQIPTQDIQASDSDFKMSGSTLVKYLGTEKSVSIPARVEVIGADAFADNSTVEEITMTDKTTGIEYNAFSNCVKLKKIKISDSVTDIKSSAFNKCTSLEEVSVGSGLQTFGSGVFAGCTNLKTLDVVSQNTCIAVTDGVIYNTDKSVLYEMLPGRTSGIYEMPSTVAEIKEYAFWDCEQLKTLDLSENLNEIPAYAFSNCKGLQAVEIPYSVRKIQMKAFSDCIMLEVAVIPESVNFIHDTAFDGCTKLKISAKEGSVAGNYAATMEVTNVARSEYEDVVNKITKSIAETESASDNSVSGNNQSGDGKTTTTTQGATDPLETEEASDVFGKTKIVGGQAVLFIDNTQTKVIDGSQSTGDGQTTGTTTDGSSTGVDGTENVSENAILGEDKGIYFPKYTLVNKDTIADQAYYLNDNVGDFIVPAEIKKIGDFSFARSSISSVFIPEGITSIGYGAFYNCISLSNVTIPKSVTSIGKSAFDKTGWIESWKNSNTGSDFLVVGDGILLAYRGNSGEIDIPEGVKQIAPEVFMNHQGIVKVSLPDTLQIVGESAFSGCGNLNSVAGGSNVTTIKDRAFYGCPLETMRIPANVTELGLNTYDVTGNATLTSTSYALFQGETLPVVTYENDSARFSNESYRNLALSGAQLAVVSSSVTIDKIKNTVLDPNYYGFRGLVVSITQEPSSSMPGTVQAKLCTTVPSSDTGLITIPETVTIHGNVYNITDMDEDIFYYYKEDISWVSQNPSDIVFPTTLASEKENRTTGITWADTVGSSNQGTEAQGTDSQGIVQIQTSEGQDVSIVSANIAGNTGSYILKASESEDARMAIEAAYKNLYPDSVSLNLIGLDLTLWDDSETIAIKKMGKHTLTLQIQVPSGMTAEQVRMVCLDEDGQLEAVETSVVMVGDKKMLEASLTHFSPYALYELTSQLMSSSSGLDPSPNTGDPIHPKWFLAMGLAGLSVVVYLKKDKKSRRSRTLKRT